LQAEYTYVAIFVLLGIFVLLTVLRTFRATSGLIHQLRYEFWRDREQHERIAREKSFQLAALRRSSRHIDGTAREIRWDQGDKLPDAIKDAAGEAFRNISEFPVQELRTPWGWPASSARRLERVGQITKPTLGSRVSQSARGFFRRKQVVDEAIRARQAQSIRSLVEDRYSQARPNMASSEIEWTRPMLPPELLRERELERFFATQAQQDSKRGVASQGRIRLVSDDSDTAANEKRVAGE
jgi:hypothetical protein